jgi:hypothetical protein
MKHLYLRYYVRACYAFTLISVLSLFPSDVLAQDSFNYEIDFLSLFRHNDGIATIAAPDPEGHLSFRRNEVKTFGTAGFVRPGAIASPAPELLILEFDVEMQVTDANSANDRAGYFYVGNDFPDNNTEPSNANTFAKFDFIVLGNNNFRLGFGGGRSISGWVKVQLAMNSSTRTLSYQSPEGERALNSKSYDLWVTPYSGNSSPVNYLRNQAAISDVPLTGFAFYLNNGDVTIRFRNARVLPVELIYFQAQPLGEKVELAWQTAWERNSWEFVVQRSHDLQEFSDLGTVAASGDTQSRNTYAFVDEAPLPGANYYRLRLVDADGTHEYSKVIDALLHPDQPQLLVSPNPATAQLIRLRAFGTDAASLRLTNLLGQEVPFRTHRPGGEVLELLPYQPLTPGLYLLSMQKDGLRQHTKVLVP